MIIAAQTIRQNGARDRNRFRRELHCFLTSNQPEFLTVTARSMAPLPPVRKLGQQGLKASAQGLGETIPRSIAAS